MEEAGEVEMKDVEYVEKGKKMEKQDGAIDEEAKMEVDGVE